MSAARPGHAPMGEVPATEAQPRRRRFGPRERHDFWVFLALAGPNILLILIFSYRPVLQNIQYSMLNWTLGSASATWVGIGNYVEFFTSPNTLDILRVTAIFTVATVGGSMVLGLIIALALNRPVRGVGLARAAVFAPYVLSGVGVGLVWLFIFDPAIGILGVILRAIGLPGPEWFRDPNLTLAMVIIVYVWKNMGYAAVIYLAGLQAIPRDLLEAAALDGASSWRTFWSVVWPLLSPITFFLLITSVLASLQAFDIIQIMTPLGNGTTTLIYEVYLQAFGQFNRAGYSATVAVVLFVLLVVLTIVQLRYVERRVHYA
ncbi:carbohydrate ABC transporter permease [Pseudonocardia thermophila]|uniref:carbohydrate ABC transporter permease n=1 Tax=Pseudonocardia thermophila TaxID=1848 RepID=UPI001F458A52|nr:sugar ABC transporter permease [Pseudonocardia thermophila]